MLAPKTGKTFGCVQCFVSFLKLKFMPLRGQFIYTVEPRYFEVPREMKKKFEIAGLRNNRGSVKRKGKSKGIRSSFEIAGTSN